jgi:acyl CoA:acetate/3-ketoacid CoA transferase alpha subunit
VEIIAKGNAEIISKFDPEEHRQWVKEKKTRDLEDKTMTVEQAVDRFVPDGSYIFFGFFGARVPMALVYQIIRRRRKNLSVGRGGLYDLDILIAAGCVKRLDRGYGGGFEVLGLSTVFRRAVASGQLEIVEWSNTAFNWRLKAGAMGIPFMPIRTMMGTDTFEHSAGMVVKCPYTGMKICIVPACNPDVAMIHVNRCDKFGNAQIDGITILDLEAAKASRRVILTTEKVVDSDRIRAEPWRTCIPHFYVDAVVEAPWGAHPSNMPEEYYIDEEVFNEWITQSKTPDGVNAFLSKYVYGVNDFDEYLEAVGGIKKLRHLREVELLRSTELKVEGT